MSLELTSSFGVSPDIYDYYGFAGGTAFGLLGGGAAGYYPWHRDNMKRGEAIPLYLTELELKVIRDKSRILCATNEYAISALANRRNYVVGRGLIYRAAPIDPEVEDDPLVEQTQKFIDIVQEINDLQEREAESCWRCDEDGEAIIRLFPKSTGSDAGMTYIRFVEPELMKSPSGDAASERSFGIETKPDDVEDIVGYHIIDDPQTQIPSFVPESRVVHFKQNTRTSAKRGLPVLYPVEANLKRAEDLLTSMTSMAKTRAKIAMIRKMKGSGRSAAEAMTQSLTEVSINDPMTQTAVNLERLRPGTILTTDGQKEYEFPHAATAASEFVLVLDAELRAIAARLQMPEWMLSAQAGNANYSSTFVAESGVVKSFEFLQDYYKRRWGEGRYGQKKSIMWRCIDHAIDCGILPEEVRSKIRILVEAPQLIVRDQDRQASMNKLYLDAGVKSRQTIQHEIGLDGPSEDKNMLNDPVAEKKKQDAIETNKKAQQEKAGGTKDGTPGQKKQPIQKEWQDDSKQTRLAPVRNFGDSA